MKIKTLYTPEEKKDININTYLAKCGIDDGGLYINPMPLSPSDPKLYTNVNKAIEYIRELMFVYLNNIPPNYKKIYILQDSDVDGILSTALMYKFLIHIGISSEYVQILHHNHKAHGLTDGIMKRIDDDCGYLIIPDAGSDDCKQCAILQEKGIKVLIIDHHNIKEDNPYAIRVTNQEGGGNPKLCGTGVVFKVISAFFNPDLWEIEGVFFGYDKSYNDWLDLIAVANIADMMSLTNYEVRMFNYYALEQLEISNPFLRFLCEQEGLSYNPTPHDIAFKIAPLLNALCRQLDKQAEKAAVLYAFIAEEDDIELFTQAYIICIEARDYQRKEADKLLRRAKKSLIETPNCIIATVPLTPYTGLIANRLLEEYKKIVFVVHEGEELISGSARSPIPFRSQLQESGYMQVNAGHEQAWGVGWNKGDTDKIIEWINKKELDLIPEDVVLYSYQADNIPLSAFGLFDNYENLWGQDIPKPKYHISKCQIDTLEVKVMGKKKDTLSFTYDGIKYIWFNTSKEKREIILSNNGRIYVDIIGDLTINVFRGKITQQVIINRLEVVQDAQKPACPITDWADIFKQ